MRWDGTCPWASARGCGRRLRITKRDLASLRVRVIQRELGDTPAPSKRRGPRGPYRIAIGKPKQSDCHPDRVHYSKGQCRRCYESAMRRAKFVRVRPVGRRQADCHPEKPMRAHGMCNACYEYKRRRASAA